MTDRDEVVSFHVGDADLLFLGVATALAARYEMRRKGGGVPLPGFPQSDPRALDLLLMGLLRGAAVALDDVPERWITVNGTPETLERLRALAAGEDESDPAPGLA